MSGNSRKFLQNIMKRISNSPILHNATGVIENASERAQAQLNSIQHAATKKYDTIVKQANGTMIVQDLNASMLQPSAPLPVSLVKWWRWYQELTGMADVEVAKHHVIRVQDKLFKCQEERRILNNQAGLIAEKLKEVYGELVQTRRDDPKYVQLTIMENKGLQEQTRIAAELRLLENAERDHFTELATAIKEYHDSQAMNAQKYKYLSILASAMLAIVSLCGSMVYNNRRIRDVRVVIADAQKKNEVTFNERFDLLEHNMSSNFSKINEALIKQADSYHIETAREVVETSFTKKNIFIGTFVLWLMYRFVNG